LYTLLYLSYVRSSLLESERERVIFQRIIFHSKILFPREGLHHFPAERSPEYARHRGYASDYIRKIRDKERRRDEMIRWSRSRYHRNYGNDCVTAKLDATREKSIGLAVNAFKDSSRHRFSPEVSGLVPIFQRCANYCPRIAAGT